MDKERFRQYGGATPSFSLNGVQTAARVVDVYDGDTMTCVLPMHDQYYKFTVRLAGIDTCEVKGKNREHALRARNRVLELVTGTPVVADTVTTRKKVKALLERDVHLVWLHCQEFDKYGRLLAEARERPDAKTFSQILIDEKLAYAYQGDTKLTEEEQVKLLDLV
jgi:endonuclease YncB( thermonuclease family)